MGKKRFITRELCIDCGKYPVAIKKRELCKKCYNNMIYYSKKTNIDLDTEIRYDKEIEFVRNFFTHKNWVYHPVLFRLKGSSYEPDFYDGERNVFIEVSGNQASIFGQFREVQVVH